MAGLLLWLALSPSLATPEATFFYHLGMLTAVLGGGVAGVFTLFLPKLCVRVQLSTLLALAFIVLVDTEGSLPVAFVFAIFLVAAIASLAVATRPVRGVFVTSPREMSTTMNKIVCPL